MDAMQITEYAQALYRTHGDRAEIEAVCRYSVEQHLATRLVRPEELFHTSVLET